MRRIIKIGQKFGKLTVLEEIKGRSGVHNYYVCKCECGNTCKVSSSHLGRETFSCGCLVKGGSYKYPLYAIYKDIKRRCYNPQRSNYKYYGGKGIKMCDEWRTHYSNFKKWALENGYTYNLSLPREERLSIDRIDPSKDYEPSNCRWIKFKENRQRRATIWQG